MNIIRRLWPALLVVTTAFALAGCESGPSQVGAAAIVGDETVSLDAVQSEIQWLIKNVPEVARLREEGKVDLLSRHVVGSRVQHKLVEKAARDEGLKADPGDVDELIAQVGGEQQAPSQFGRSRSNVREFAEDYVLIQELAKKYVDRISIDVVGALVSEESPGSTARDKALDLGRKLADDPERAKQIAAEAGGQVLDESYVLAEVLTTEAASLAATPLFAVKAGTVVVVQPSRQEGAVWLVGLVTEREVSDDKLPGEQDQNAATPQVLSSFGLQLLGRVADEIGGVTINPRYGVWDRAAVSVAEDRDSLSGHLLTADTDRAK